MSVVLICGVAFGYCNPRITRSCNPQVTKFAVGGQAATASSIPALARP